MKHYANANAEEVVLLEYVPRSHFLLFGARANTDEIDFFLLPVLLFENNIFWFIFIVAIVGDCETIENSFELNKCDAR